MENEKIKLNYLHTCDQVLVSYDGKVSLINIFSEIKSTGLPVIYPRFSVLTNITGPVGEYTQKIEIISPEGNEILAFTEAKSEIKSYGGNNFIANFINIPFKVEGKYWIKVTIDGENVLSKKDEHFIWIKKIDK